MPCLGVTLSIRESWLPVVPIAKHIIIVAVLSCMRWKSSAPSRQLHETEPISAMARPASRKAVSSLPAIANIDEQLDEVVMCNYCGGSGVVNLSSYRHVPSPLSGISYCPYCSTGREKAAKNKLQERQDMQTKSDGIELMLQNAQRNSIKL